MSSLWETLGNGPEEDDLVHEAALDYPVLAEILTERPPLPASTRVAIRRTASADSDPSISGNMSALVEDQLDDSLSVEAKGWLKMVKDVAFPGEVDPDDWKHSPSFDWCFSGETEFLTYDGYRAFKDVAGTTQLVLDGRGIWVEAQVRSFGVQPLRKLTLRKGRGVKVIHVTGEHRWLVNGERIVTDDLRPGMALDERLARSYLHHWRPSPFGVAHGIVFGDGTLTSETVERTFRPGPARVDLWGDKDAQLLRFFEGCTMTPATGGANQDATGVRVTGLPRHFKERPSLNADCGYLYGWLAGYFAADGRVARNGSNIEMSSARREDLEFVQAVCNRLTIATHEIRTVVRTGCSGRGKIHDYRMDTKGVCSLCSVERELHSLAFVPSTLAEEFFLIAEHAERFRSRKTAGNNLGRWWVASVEETDRVEEVFCAVVPTTESFVLQDNILTSNCRFRRDTRCYFPKELDQEHTKVAGYTVWRVVDRGPCPRIKWDAQRECRVSEPGPNSKHPDALIECTRNWEDGGQRDGHVRRRG